MASLDLHQSSLNGPVQKITMVVLGALSYYGKTMSNRTPNQNYPLMSQHTEYPTLFCKAGRMQTKGKQQGCEANPFFDVNLTGKQHREPGLVSSTTVKRTGYHTAFYLTG